MSRLPFLPRSLRWRLQLWLAFLLVCVLAGFGITVYQLQKLNRFDRVDGELQTRIAALTAGVRELYVLDPPVDGTPRERPRREKPSERRPPPPDDFGFRGPPPDHFPPPGEGRGFEGRGLEGRGFNGRGRRGPGPKPTNLTLPVATAALFGEGVGDYYYVVWYRDGSVLKRSAGAPADLTRPGFSERDTLPHLRTRNGFREALHCSGLGDCVLAGRTVKGDLQATRDFGWALLAAGGAVLALGLGLGFWFTTRAIRPIEKISAAASRISQGNLSERVEGADSGDELGNLAGVLNLTFSRLESAFERQKQFTADAAHELRTPLAVIISEAQTTLARERGAQDYRETVEACLETAQQMRRLTESLLELARFDGAADGKRETVDVAGEARRAMERIRPLAGQHDVTIESSFKVSHAWVNAERIGQVLTNLLTNAIYYNKPGGQVRIGTEMLEDQAEIRVSDTGIGIAAADIPHIFDRFYRVNQARSRIEGRTGLGLAISKVIVEAEGGSIDVSSVVGEGTTFTVRLPQVAKR